MAVQALVKGKGAGILNGHCPSPCPFFMDEKPGIVRFTPRSTSKSAMLIAVAVAVGVQVALCAVLVAIHFQELWLPAVQNGEVEMEFVRPSEEVLQELAEVQPVPVEPVAAPSTVSPVPEISADEDLLAMKLPENEDCSDMKDFLPEETPTEYLPEELSSMRLSMREVKPRRPVKTPAVSLPGQPSPDENVTPDKKVRYKHAPSLPNSVNSSRVGKVNAVVKVVVGVNPRGEPSSVNLLQSTGNAELDRLFMRWVKENWTFYPAEKDGAPIASKVVVPVRLNID